MGLGPSEKPLCSVPLARRGGVVLTYRAAAAGAAVVLEVCTIIVPRVDPILAGLSRASGSRV